MIRFALLLGLLLTATAASASPRLVFSECPCVHWSGFLIAEVESVEGPRTHLRTIALQLRPGVDGTGAPAPAVGDRWDLPRRTGDVPGRRMAMNAARWNDRAVAIAGPVTCPDIAPTLTLSVEEYATLAARESCEEELRGKGFHEDFSASATGEASGGGCSGAPAGWTAALLGALGLAGRRRWRRRS